MSESAIASGTASAERPSLGAVLGQRNIWLFLLLGVGTGMPVATYWINVFPRVDLAVDRALMLVWVGFGVPEWLALAAAPFLDRYRAPGLARLGYRRSWLALALIAALVLIAFHLVTALASEGAALRFAQLSGVLAIPVFALLWIALNALRIHLFRGRAHAVAFAVQYFGALITVTIASKAVVERITPSQALVFAMLLALSLGAVLLLKEAHPPAPVQAPAASFPALLARSWTSFFARHGRAAGLLLAAIAFYALAGSAAEYLGKHGQIVDILGSGRLDFDADAGRALDAASTQETALSALGALAGMAIAFAMAPARAFVVLLLSILGLLGFFLLCKVYLGFTVFTVAGLYALRTLIAGASLVIYMTIVARLTAPTETAGHFAIVSLFGGLFWLSEAGLGVLGPTVGSYALATAAALAAVFAIVCMRLAARTSRPPG